MERFEGNFTQQEPIDEATIARAMDILRGGRLHRYNVAPGETSEASLLEEEYARYQGAKYCLAVTSGGQALQLALRAAGVRHGDKVLANAWTLAPVPGAIHAVGGAPVFVEIGDDWRTNLTDLIAKADASGARYFMLSHMRGHIANMPALVEICRARGIKIIEDCAHTMGATYAGVKSGNYGDVAAFSAQTYKHINSGEGGFLTTDNAEIAAAAVVMSGSYMLYERHGARPSAEVFDRLKLDQPNCSCRLDNLRAALLRSQLEGLESNVERWNARYQALEGGLRGADHLRIVERPQAEHYVGSSFQFHYDGSDLPSFVAACAARGVEIKWFGAKEPNAFTSRYDSWTYVEEKQHLPQTLNVLSSTCDIRVPLTFSVEDCAQIARIIVDVARGLSPVQEAAE